MSDVNRGPISSTEKQFLDDLEIAKRLSLDEYEKEKRRWSKPFSNHSSNSKRISSTTPQHENSTDDKSRKISITPRPRPFSRAVSTNTSGGSGATHLSTSVSAGKIIQLPSPVSIDPPPESLLRRNRSLPYRYRNNQRREDNNTIDGTTSSSSTTTTTAITRSSVASNSNLNGNNLNDTDCSITLPSTPSSSTTLNNFNSASDDLILLASPKVTPKFPLSGLRIPNFCDISSSSTISISSNGLNILSPSLTNDSLSPTTPLNGAIDLRSTFNPMYQVSPAPSEPLHFNNGHLKTSMTFPIPTSSSPIVRNNNNKLSLGGLRIPPALSPTSTPTLLFQQTKTKQTGTGTGAKTAMSGVYSKLSEQLKSLSCQEDLIDLGQADGRNILEYFDPILLREKTREEERTDAHEGNNSHQFQTNVITSPTTTSIHSTKRDSIESSSCMSTTTTTSFSYHAGGPPSLSLYPSLQEFHNTDNLYGGLDHENDKDDASSFYDVYNPFEYLYTVSCSSPSASSTYESNFSNSLSTPSRGRSLGFSHFTESQPLPSPFPTRTSSSLFPPALPPRNSEISLEQFVQPTTAPSAKVPLRFTASSASNTSDASKRHGRLYENIESVKHFASTDSEIQAFYEMIRELRFSNRHVDSTTNGGFIRCSTLEAKCLEALSLKIIVWKDEDILSEPAAFTSDVSACPDMIIDQSLMNFELGGSGRDYLLRVKGLNEYMCSDVPLAKYRYVQECIKLDQDIHLILVPKVLMGAKSWARTPRDDADCVGINIDDILPQTHSKTITYKDIRIPLEVIDRESDKLKEKLGGSLTTKDVASLQLSSASLIQPVKAVCVLLGEVQTVENIECLDTFAKLCNEWNAKVKNTITTMEGESRRRTKIGNDCNNRLSFVEILPRHSLSSVLGDALKDNILSALYRLEDSVRHLVEMYSKSFPVSFRMKEPSETIRVGWNSSCKPMSDMIESFLLRVGAVHRLKPEWLTSYLEYFLTAEVFHGRRWMGKAITGNKTVTKSDNNLFFNTVVFHSWINFEHLPVCILPRESRVVLTLYGRKQNEDNNSIYDTVELGWTSMQCFNFKGLLAQGKYLLPFWPVGLVQKKLGPAPDSSFSSDENAPLLTIEFTDFGYDLPFPEVPSAVLSRRDFNSLDPGTQVLLKDIFEHSTFTKFPPEVVEVLWEKRHYLHEFPGALPKVLLAAQLWDWASLAELHAMLHCWEPLEPIDALQLLLPCFPDAKVREQGIHWVSKMADEELINMLPQLMEALSFETFDYSPLARFLLKKALSCLKISHHLFWLLVSQVGLGKWASEFSNDSQIISSIPPPDSHNVYDPKRRRLELMFNSMMIMSGAKWKGAFISQVKLMEGFYDVATQVKATSSSSRQSVLVKELHRVQTCIFSACNSIPLPLSPSYDVATIDIKSCSYFTSASVPLKIGFVNGLAEKGNIATLYKVGDDIRQDMLTIQIIRVVEKWWLEAGLDLRVLTFSCVPTGFKQGFVEMVPNAETLCRIQAEHGLTGAFRNRPISEWLAKMNPSTLDYRRAIENFTLSCAAYCVVTYILGICDRHNDNIMLTKKGHLFHIDFGKFLGDAQMFGSIIKRDRSPFVLTSDMVYVINDGEKDSSKFHRFVELCCQAFRIVRENGDTLLNLFALMATAGIPGVNNKSVIYVQDALLPDCSNSEAAARFASFIQESLQNWFTPVNFFLHTLAQMPFPSDSSDDPTKLSFVPNLYTMEMDGRIEGVKLVSFVKNYDPEKFYVYTVQVRRRGQTEWTSLNRSYKEFLEFHTKLCINFPKAVGTLGSLPRGSGLTRSQVKQVTEKRKVILQAFLEALFTLADEISHSHLVYTFFHPLLRDEEQHQEDEKERKNSSRVSLSRNPARIHGQIKISLEYQRGALHVLILHAVDLTCPSGTPPSPYVKTYLQPDPARKTKRKTKVVKRSQHPTFMEMIEYRLPLELIRIRTLSVSVWHHDPFQENNFLGGVSIPMSSLTVGKETSGTHTLGNINSFL